MRYGRLEVIGTERRNRRVYYTCRCSCGTIKTIRADNIRSGATRSCGCLSKEVASERLKGLYVLAQEEQY